MGESKQQLQRQVLRSLQSLIARCAVVPQLPHFRCPPAKVTVETLFSDLDDDDLDIDDIVENFPWGLPSDELISMAWDGILSSVMAFRSIQLDPETSVYFEFNDSEELGPFFLAVADGLAPAMAHESFLKELFRSNGATFDTGVCGSPPTEITSMFPRSQFVEPLLAVADSAIECGCEDFWEEMVRLGSQRGKRHTPRAFDVCTDAGRRKAVKAYLAAVHVVAGKPPPRKRE